jgi:hypothetical protein
MTYREDELDDAIERYIEALDMDALESYVRNDMQTIYSKTDNDTVDEFIAQMNGDW